MVKNESYEVLKNIRTPHHPCAVLLGLTTCSFPYCLIPKCLIELCFLSSEYTTRIRVTDILIWFDPPAALYHRGHRDGLCLVLQSVGKWHAHILYA